MLTIPEGVSIRKAIREMHLHLSLIHILSAANRKALSAPDPDPKSIYDFVIPEPYQPQKYKEGIHQAEGEKTFMVNAINETLKAEFRHTPDTFIWGQDVANKEKGGVFNVTKGMQQEFGDARVFSAPIAEDYIAVSYTHLDVYKRQEERKNKNCNKV